MALVTLLPLVLALGTEPDSLVERLGRLDHALYSGKADSVWEVASARAAQPGSGRLPALEAGSAGGMLNRPEAEAMVQRALGADSTLGDPVALQAAILLGSRAILRGDEPTARLWLDRATAAASRHSDPRARAEALSLLAELDLRTGNARGALARLALAEEATPPTDTLSRSRLSCSRSRASAFLGLHASADSSARAGVSLARAAGLRTLAGSCLASVGIAQAQRGTLFAADTSLGEAVVLLEDAGAPRVLGAALQWHGYVLRELAQLGRAEVTLRAAVGIATALQDRNILGWSYLNLGLVASAFGDLERARDEVAQAAAAFDGHLDAWGHYTALLTLAHLQRQLGDSMAAVRNTDAVLTWAGNAGNAYMALLARTQLAWLAEARGDLAGAQVQLDSAVVTGQRGGLMEAQVGTRYQQARLDIARGRHAAAIPVLTSYLTAMPSISARRYAARARLAEAHAGTGNIGGAEAELTEAMLELDRWRASLEEDALRRAVFGASVDDPDHDLGVATVIAAIAEAGEVSAAFMLAERRRGRALHDRLLTLRAARLQSGQTSGDALSIGEPLPAIRAALGPDAALVLFVTGRGGEPTTAFVLTSETLAAVALPPADSLRREVTRALALLESQDSLPTGLRDRLGAAVVQPWAQLLPGRVRLVVLVPDDLLHRVPFALLPGERGGQPLGARYALTRVPSASVFASLRQARARPEGAILAFGDPSPALDTGAGLGLTSRGGRSRASLPGARSEVRSLARRVEGVTILTGDGAREAALRSAAAGNARLIHFASHADVDDRSPVESRLFLAPGDGADGQLTAAEIEGLDLAAELVVLSACHTAGGRWQAGEGIEGITAPLLSAGVRSVVASQWDVGDRATARFMRDFYAALMTRPVAYALAEAQLVARERGEPPAVWAAFVVVGDPLASPGLTARSPGKDWVLLALLGLAGVIWWWRRRLRAAPRPGEIREA